MVWKDIIPWGRKSDETQVQEERNEMETFDSLHREINRVFDSFWNDFRGFPTYGSLLNRVDRGLGQSWTRSFSPKFNINETEKDISIDVELPGLSENEVNVDLEDGVLTISGEKKFQKEDKKDNYHLVEHSYGSFRRSVRLPEGIKEDAIEAKMKNGVMQIHIPKEESAIKKSKRIEIKKD